MADYFQCAKPTAKNQQRDLGNPNVMVVRGLLRAIPASMVGLMDRRRVHVELERLQVQASGAHCKWVPELLPIGGALQTNFHGAGGAMAWTLQECAYRSRQ